MFRKILGGRNNSKGKEISSSTSSHGSYDRLKEGHHSESSDRYHDSKARQAVRTQVPPLVAEVNSALLHASDQKLASMQKGVFMLENGLKPADRVQVVGGSNLTPREAEMVSKHYVEAYQSLDQSLPKLRDLKSRLEEQITKVERGNLHHEAEKMKMLKKDVDVMIDSLQSHPHQQVFNLNPYAATQGNQSETVRKAIEDVMATHNTIKAIHSRASQQTS